MHLFRIQFDCYEFLSSLDSLGEARFDLEKFADMKDFGKDYVAFLQKNRQANGLQKDLATDADVAGLDMKMETVYYGDMGVFFTFDGGAICF